MRKLAGPEVTMRENLFLCQMFIQEGENQVPTLIPVTYSYSA